MAELSNNPFIDHTSSALSRYPNIDAVSSSSSPTAPSAPHYSTAWPQQQQQQQSPPGYIGASPTGYTQQQYFQQPQWPQQQQQQQPQQPQQQQQQHQYQSQMQAPYPSTNFQSPGTFGQQQQQFVGQVNPLATGYQQSQLQGRQYSDYPTRQAAAAASYGYQQQSQPQQTGYGGGYPQPQHLQQQQLQHPHQQHQLLAQFDPYVNVGQLSSPGQGPGPGSAAAASSSMVPITNGAVGSPPPGVQHPRMFIQTHKVELEAWDPPTWRQVQNVFEALKTAWEMRKRAAETQVRALGGTAGFFGGGAGYGAYGGYGGGYQMPQAQEVDRLNSLIKEANTNVDIVAAAALQMSEVFAGYRHSGDIASKRRVRESCNAALSGLPEYPPPTL
ncbi:hypothetical protein V8E52_010066 [Russula decolorans]